MAGAPLVKGFDINDYLAASKLGLTREQFERLGPDGMARAIGKKNYIPEVPSVPSFDQVPGYNVNPMTGEAMAIPGSTQIGSGMYNPESIDATINQANTAINQQPGSVTSMPYGVEQVQNPASTFSDNSYSNPMNSIPKMTPEEINADSLLRARDAKTAIDEQTLKDMNAFDWTGWGGLGLQGIDTAMNVGMYKPKRDYLTNSVASLKQQRENAEEAHNQSLGAKKSYSSAFSK